MFVVDYRILPRLPGASNEKAQFSLLSESVCRYLFPGLLELFDKSVVPLKDSETRRFFVDKQLFLIAKQKLFDFPSFACAFLLHDYRKWLRVWARAAAAAKDSSHFPDVPKMDCSVYENRLNCPPSFAGFVVANEAERPFQFKPCRFRLCPFCNFRLALRLFFRLNQANRVFGRASNWQLPLKAHLIHFDFDYWEKDKLRKFKRKLSLLQEKGKKVCTALSVLLLIIDPIFTKTKRGLQASACPFFFFTLALFL